MLQATFEIPNRYQQCLLDLAIGHDTHFDIDFYAYEARSSGDWNSVGPCGSRSIIEKVYELFRDRHQYRLLQGTLVNRMFTQKIVIDPNRLPFSDAMDSIYTLDRWEELPSRQTAGTCYERKRRMKRVIAVGDESGEQE